MLGPWRAGFGAGVGDLGKGLSLQDHVGFGRGFEFPRVQNLYLGLGFGACSYNTVRNKIRLSTRLMRCKEDQTWRNLHVLPGFCFRISATLNPKPTRRSGQKGLSWRPKTHKVRNSHRFHGSSFLWFIFRILSGSPKMELQWSLWPMGIAGIL